MRLLVRLRLLSAAVLALGLVAGGRARTGQTLYVSIPGGEVPVEVASPVFYDPQGRRLHA